MNYFDLNNYYIVEGNVGKMEVSRIGYYASGKKYTEKWVYNYFNGNKIQGKFFKEGKLTSIFEYQLDSLNRNTKNIIQYKTPLIGWRKEIFEFEYSGGNRIIKRDLNSENKLLRYAKYEYDEKGNPTKLSFYTGEGELIGYESADYDYDENTYNYQVFNYREKAVNDELKYCNIDTLNNSKNEYNDFVKIRWPSSPRKKKIFHILKYKYDKKGNWISRNRNVLSSGKKSKYSRIKRKITYRKE